MNCEDRLRELGLLSLEIIKVELVAVFRYSGEGYREVGASLLAEVHSERTRGSRKVTKEEIPIRHKENINGFRDEGGKTLE